MQQQQAAVLPAAPALHPHALLGNNAALQAALQEGFRAAFARNSDEEGLQGDVQLLGGEPGGDLRPPRTGVRASVLPIMTSLQGLILSGCRPSCILNCSKCRTCCSVAASSPPDMKFALTRARCRRRQVPVQTRYRACALQQIANRTGVVHLKSNDFDFRAGLPPPIATFRVLRPHLRRPLFRAIVHTGHAEGVLVLPLHAPPLTADQPVALVWESDLQLRPRHLRRKLA